MHTRIEEVLHCLDAELARLRSAVESVPAERRDARPGPERWSVAEVLEHLLAVEKSILKACTRQLDAAREAGLSPETETSSILPSMPTERVANRERRLISPERLMPRGMDAATAWSEIEATRVRLNDFVRSCDGLAIGQVAFSHPALGELNLYQWLLFAAGHHARHAAQIREIGEQLA